MAHNSHQIPEYFQERDDLETTPYPGQDNNNPPPLEKAGQPAPHHQASMNSPHHSYSGAGRPLPQPPGISQAASATKGTNYYDDGAAYNPNAWRPLPSHPPSARPPNYRPLPRPPPPAGNYSPSVGGPPPLRTTISGPMHSRGPGNHRQRGGKQVLPPPIQASHYQQTPEPSQPSSGSSAPPSADVTGPTPYGQMPPPMMTSTSSPSHLSTMGSSTEGTASGSFPSSSTGPVYSGDPAPQSAPRSSFNEHSDYLNSYYEEDTNANHPTTQSNPPMTNTYQAGGPPPPPASQPYLAPGQPYPPPQPVNGHGPRDDFGVPYQQPPPPPGPPGSYYERPPRPFYQQSPHSFSHIPTYGPGPGSHPPSMYNEGGFTMSATNSMMGPPRPQSPKKPSLAMLDSVRDRATQSADPQIQMNYVRYVIEHLDDIIGDEANPMESEAMRQRYHSEVLKILKRLTSQGGFGGRGAYPDAQFWLADAYNKGLLGLAPDHDKAFNLYQQSSKQSHPQGTYRTAVCYEMGAGTKRDAHRAVQYYRKASALGDTGAMYKLGVILLKGLLSQPCNPREGTTWLKRAADQADRENPHALHELAICYEKGGVPSILVDEGYAKELFIKAAQLGYVPSQFKLGFCYEYGTLTCPQDPKRSIAWYTRAAEQGDPEAELALSGWYLTGSDNVLEQSDTEAYLWARKAADKGLAKAEYAIGYYNENGIGVKQDMEEARRWYMRSAAQGHKRAMNRLTELKRMGTGASGGRKKHNRNGHKDDNCTIF
ncbi:hypothetical protein IWQ61_010140 [Dispira simplex]|nr:hypothetical protein IWQ61_010140 [Dispira simplex]